MTLRQFGPAHRVVHTSTDSTVPQGDSEVLVPPSTQSYTPPPPLQTTLFGLATLPEHRQRQWLWQLLLDMERSDIDTYIADRAARSTQCLRRQSDGRLVVSYLSHLGAPTAQLGTDGLYHLTTDAGHWCEGRTVRGSLLKHWLDETASHPKSRQTRWGDGRFGEWRFSLTDTQVAPHTVPYDRRCPLLPRSSAWPPFANPANRRGQIYEVVFGTFGNLCAACGVTPATMIDHDHFTGIVRGVLCATCNQHVDWCPHRSGCVYAEYLNNPPAGRLQLQYAGPEKCTRDDIRRAAALGVPNRRATAAASEWTWTPLRKDPTRAGPGR